MTYSYHHSERLIFSSPRGVKAIKKEFARNEEILWLYLGKDFFKRRDMESKLGKKFKRLDIAKLHDAVAKDIRPAYTRWIDCLNRAHGDKLDWWFNSVSTRNIYNDNVFQHVCYLEILNRLWRSVETMPKLIIVESIGLARALHKWASAEGISVTIINDYGFLASSLKQVLLPFLYGLKFVATQILRQAAAISSRTKFGRKNLKNIQLIIIDTFLHDTSISEDGHFKDRYFPFLYEYLMGKGFTLLVHPTLFGFRTNYFSIYNRMRRSSASFIIQEDFLSFFDYLCALSHPIKVMMRKMTIKPFHHFDLSDIIEEERRKQPFSFGMQAVLIYRLFIRLGLAGIKPLQIIDWYENQVIDKALIAGARAAFPDVKIIGTQLYVTHPNELSFYPSQSDVDARLVPDVLLETSEYQCKIAQEFTTEIPCIPAAALRYAHLFEFENGASGNKEAENKTVLVLLPFDIQESVELLWAVKDALSQIGKRVAIFIKCHPDYSLKRLMRAFGEGAWPSCFNAYTGSMGEALNAASVIISSNSSSMIEAAAKGIPVIFIGRQTVLNKNYLSGLKIESAMECFSSSELVPALNTFLNATPDKLAEYKEAGRKIRDNFFMPLTEENLLPFLNFQDSDS